jgi:hypothetical protein
MSLYRVAWYLDVAARSAEEAAEVARAMQVRPGTLATRFEVIPMPDGSMRLNEAVVIETDPMVPDYAH